LTDTRTIVGPPKTEAGRRHVAIPLHILLNARKRGRPRDVRKMRHFPLTTGMSRGVGPATAASALALTANQQRRASQRTRHTASDRARRWFSWGFCGSLNPEIAGYPLS
jgi:hypothetical protein